MNDFFQLLYGTFLMRDVLGKIAPGATILLAISIWLDRPPVFLAPDMGLHSLRYPILLLLSYLVGLALHGVGEQLGIICFAPRRIAPYSSKRATTRDMNDDFLQRMALFASSKDLPPTAQRLRERFAYEKDGAGNMSLALALASLSMLASYLRTGDPPCGIAVAPLLLAIPLYAVHLSVAFRQGLVEINILLEGGVLSEERAKSMRANLN